MYTISYFRSTTGQQLDEGIGMQRTKVMSRRLAWEFKTGESVVALSSISEGRNKVSNLTKEKSAYKSQLLTYQNQTVIHIDFRILQRQQNDLQNLCRQAQSWEDRMQRLKQRYRKDEDSSRYDSACSLERQFRELQHAFKSLCDFALLVEQQYSQTEQNIYQSSKCIKWPAAKAVKQISAKYRESAYSKLKKRNWKDAILTPQPITGYKLTQEDFFTIWRGSASITILAKSLQVAYQVATSWIGICWLLHLLLRLLTGQSTSIQVTDVIISLIHRILERILGLLPKTERESTGKSKKGKGKLPGTIPGTEEPEPEIPQITAAQEREFLKALLDENGTLEEKALALIAFYGWDANDVDIEHIIGFLESMLPGGDAKWVDLDEDEQQKLLAAMRHLNTIMTEMDPDVRREQIEAYIALYEIHPHPDAIQPGVVYHPDSSSSSRSLPFTPPPATNSQGNRSAEAYQAVIESFRVGSNSRYSRDSNTYCNIFLWDVTSAMGCEIPHYANNSTGEGHSYDSSRSYSENIEENHELNANATIDWLRNHGEASGWRKITAEEAIARANAGYPTAAAWQNTGGIGHVGMVCPQQEGDTGVMIAQAGATNFDYGTLEQGFGNRGDAMEYYTHD